VTPMRPVMAHFDHVELRGREMSRGVDFL
jgi:hypothetical protein